MLKQLRQKNFWINAGLAFLSLGLVCFLIFQAFNFYTRHGKSVKIPDLTGMSADDARKSLSSKGLVFVLKDSVSEVKEADLQDVSIGAVLYQNPIPGEEVKPGRRIYVTLRSVTPVMVAMPNLKDLPFANALEILQDYGLKLGKKIEKPGPPPVMDMKYEGKSIKPGTMIAKGSKVDLVVGKGNSEVKVQVPNLIGLTRKRAIETLSSVGLNLGAENPKPEDTEGDLWIVTDQYPEASDEPNVSEGSDVDLWY